MNLAGNDAYAVLVASPEDFRPPDIARALAALRKVPVQDCLPPVRRSWGILEENIAAAAARELASVLTGAGLSSVAVPRGLIEDLVPPRPTTGLDFSPAGLSPKDRAGQPEKIAWETVALLAAAGFRQSSSKKVTVEEGPDAARRALNLGLSLATGLPIRSKKQRVEKTVESSDLVFYLDVILKGGAGRLRIDAANFDYSCLRERKTYGAFMNFKLLIQDLARFAGQTRLNRGARILLENRPVREMGYEALADLERESRWLLTLQALRP